MSSETSGSAPGKNPSEARTRATGHPTPRNSSRVGASEETEDESSSAAVREPEVKVVLRALEGHVEAPEGPLETLLDGRRLLLLLLGHLFGSGFDAGPAAVEEDEGADAAGVGEGGLEGDEAAHGVTNDHGVSHAEVVEDADHVARVRLEPVARLGFFRISPAPQVYPDEGT